MKNKFIISTMFLLFICPFLVGQDRLAMAKPRGSDAWGYINEKGQWIIANQYQTCYNFTKDGWAVIHKTSDGFSFINAKNQIMPLEVEDFDVFKIGAKEIAYGYKVEQAPLISFDDGLCPLIKKGKWGFINTQGKIVHQFKYERIWPFNEGAATALIGRDYYILHKDGKEIKIATEIITIGSFSDGLVHYKDKSGRVGFLDKNGQVVIRPLFESVGPFVNGLAWAKDVDTGLVGFIDKKGKWAIEPKFDLASAFDLIAGLARVKFKGKWEYVDKNGKLLELKIKTTLYSKFENGLAKGELNGKLGFFNNKGEWAIRPEHDAVGVYNDGYVPAEHKKRWGILDSSGNWVTEPTFEMIMEVVPLKKE